MTDIKIQKNGAIAEITLNSPDTLNLIEEDTFEKISLALDGLEQDDRIKVILIRANCGVSKKTDRKVFSAGVNLKKYDEKFELLDKAPNEFRQNLIKNRDLPKKIEKYPKPVVIAIDGLVTGGFFEVALACDVILASTSAAFSLNEVNIGLIPGYGGIQRLVKFVGKSRAYEIITTCRQIPAYEAVQLGIAAQVYDDDRFEDKVKQYCTNLSLKPQNALRLAKQVIERVSNGENIDEAEVDCFMQAVSSSEARDNINNFLRRN